MSDLAALSTQKKEYFSKCTLDLLAESKHSVHR